MGFAYKLVVVVVLSMGGIGCWDVSDGGTAQWPEGTVARQDLSWVGPPLFDRGTRQVLPVVVGGWTHIGFKAENRTVVSRFEVGSTDPDQLSARSGSGLFDAWTKPDIATSGGVDGFLVVRGESAGHARVWVRDEQGQPIGFAEVSADFLASWSVEPLDGRRDLAPGTMDLGVSLYVAGLLGGPVRGPRAVDYGLTLNVDGVPATRLSWDCFRAEIPDVDEVTITLVIGGFSYSETMAVVPDW